MAISAHTKSKKTGSITHQHGRHAIRWYVLTLPPGHRGSATRGLEQECAYRASNGLAPFDFFAPSYVDASTDQPGRRPLFFNYVFVQASESEILQMKKRRPLFNFLRRVADSSGGHFPYVSDETMANLRLLAAAYNGELPAYTPDPDMLRKGDRVRIRGGRFNGVEATLLRTPSGPREELVVCVDSWMWVPVMRIAPGHFEILQLSAHGRSKYSALDNDSLLRPLREALTATHTPEGPGEADRHMAREIAFRLGALEPESNVLKAKHLAMMLQAYAVADDHLRLAEAVASAEKLLAGETPEQSRALLLVSLYGATRRFRDRALSAVEPWRTEAAPKKSKRNLIAWLDKLDACIQSSSTNTL